MTRKELIDELDRIDKLLIEEVDTEQLSDYAREQAHYCIEGAIQFLEENEE